VLYRAEEAVAMWRAIEAPLLWVEGANTDMTKWWGDRYPRAEFDARLANVKSVDKLTLGDCGHMLHHDQPAALADALKRFLD
jgi:pimeloyl-ACP methyl ester carboxylesterase